VRPKIDAWIFRESGRSITGPPWFRSSYMHTFLHTSKPSISFHQWITLIHQNPYNIHPLHPSHISVSNHHQLNSYLEKSMMIQRRIDGSEQIDPTVSAFNEMSPNLFSLIFE
jgi:hypothetical protein